MESSGPALPASGCFARYQVAIRRSACQLLSRARVQRVLVLPVASHGGDQVPAVSLDQLDYLTDLQGHRSLHLLLPPLVSRSSRGQEMQSRAGRLCCWHVMGSLRQWSLLRQARPAQALQHRPSYLNDRRSRCVRTARGRSKKIDVVPGGRSKIRIKPLTCVGTAGFEPATP
jgi:hypothetical protein